MNPRHRLAVALFAATLAVSLLAASAAAADTITPSCTVGGQTAPCSTAWYTSSVSVVWQTDTPPVSTSGCSLGIANQFTSDTDETLSCSATWSDGTSATYSFPLEVEVSTPTISVVPARAADDNGWYTSAVSATVTGNSFSGIASCTGSTYSGPDATGATLSGTCTDNAGKTVSGTSTAFQYEESTPTITSTALPSPDHDGWYTNPVAATVSGSSFSGIASCSSSTYSGPDSTNATDTVTCTDNAGKTVSGTSPAFQYEASAPTVSVDLARSPDHDGWYTGPVAAKVGGSSFSGIASCTSPTYSGPDSSTATISGSCTDNAGKTTTATSTSFQYETSGPTVSIALARPPDHNGWYTGPVGATVTGTSVSGGVSCLQPASYSGPDTASATLSGSCTDNAGETSSSNSTFKYETLGPAVSVTLGRPPDHNGWYTGPVGATVTGTSISGGVTCTKPSTYSGPDSATAAISGSCTDEAGETNSGSAPFKYETSGPTVSVTLARAPDHDGWYTHAVSATVTGSSISGGVACTQPATYSGPDSATAAITVSCTDNAGETNSGAATFQYEANGPTVSVALARPPDHNGWYTSPVGAAVTGSSVSGGITCTKPTNYSGPDSTAASISGSCTDNAGETNSSNATFQYETSGPTVSVTLARAPDHNGWYTHAITGTPGGGSISGISSCTQPTTYSGPDTATASITGSCTDNAGETNTSTDTFHYEAKGPTVSVALARPPDHNGWYTSQVQATVTGSSVSGGISCTSPPSYSGPDSATATITGSCSDDAGESNTNTASFQYETSGPTVSVVLARGPDHNGWYTSPVGATVSGTSVSGGLTCTKPDDYSAPDTTSAAITGSCTDNAGEANTASSPTFRYEASSPTITSIALPSPNNVSPDNGSWYTNPVTATVGGQSFSKIASCSSTTYSGTDSKSATVTGTCTDNAGKTVSGTSAAFQYEASSPTVSMSLPSPPKSGWYIDPVTASVSGSSFSGIFSCTQPTYSGPNAPNATLTGSCADNAGKTVSTTSQPFEYEGSGPNVFIALARAPDHNGWYTHSIGTNVTGTSVSGGISCTQPSYAGPDSATATVSATCSDNAGETTRTTSAPFHYEANGPSVSITLSRPPDHNGWYTRPVGATVTGDSVSGGISCTQPTYSGPNATAATVTGTCTDSAGESAAASSAPLNYETSTPTVSIGLSRAPDANGWYNHAVSATVNGSSFSGIASCTSPTYAGPDSQSATISASCIDNAGKIVNGTTPLFRYDGTSPVQGFTAAPADQSVTLHWTTTAIDPLTSVKITRFHGAREAVVYDGTGDVFTDRHLRDGQTYTYTLIATDRAGNVVSESLVIVPRPRVLGPVDGASVSAPPLLTWTPVHGASYYNVQLYRSGAKILSLWPTRDSLKLKRVWLFAGRRYSLGAAVYRWYVWPGYGPRRAARYGRLIGTATFFSALYGLATRAADMKP